MFAATDGSEHAIKAVILAGDRAAKYRADLTMFHVLLREAAPGSVYTITEHNQVPVGPIDRIADIENSGTAIASAAMPMAYVPLTADPR